ncbi:hypothetical protein HRH25_06580 [Flavisolibacter sp. BT320]|nr:hypothetical protein [Flavisolibacter longurius]
MKKTCVLRFRSLDELAQFLKTIQPKSYTVNTVRLTITASLTPFERSLALDNYKAEEVKTVTI